MQQAALEGLRKELDTFVPRVQQVMRQAKQRIFGGDTHVAEKLVSIFEPTTEIIRKGKASKPTEFGKMVKIQESENQIITDYAVYEKRPSDSELVIPALDAHEKKLGCTPRLVAGDAAFYSSKNEAAAHEKGVKRVCIPSRHTKSADRKREQKKRWFKQGQKWRTGCEGRISLLKRRHGLRRCLYKGNCGMKRWVGLGVIAHNLHHLGTVLAARKNLRTPADELAPRFSPDGRWIAYRSNESGNAEIYVRPYPAGNVGKSPISSGGGLYALWANNGRELYYETADNRTGSW